MRKSKRQKQQEAWEDWMMSVTYVLMNYDKVAADINNAGDQIKSIILAMQGKEPPTDTPPE